MPRVFIFVSCRGKSGLEQTGDLTVRLQPFEDIIDDGVVKEAYASWVQGHV
jgi:hypothetical protein